jgi:hypothetical protein
MRVWHTIRRKGWVQSLIIIAVCGPGYYYSKLNIFKYILCALVFLYLMAATAICLGAALESTGLFDIESGIVTKPTRKQVSKLKRVLVIFTAVFYSIVCFGLYWIPPTGKNSFFIGLVILLVVYCTIQALRKHSWIKVPSHSTMSLCAYFSLAVGSLRYVYYGKSTIYVSLAILLLIVSIYGLIKSLYFAVTISYIVKRISKNNTTIGSCYINTPYVLSRSSLPPRFIGNFFFMINQLIWRFKYSEHVVDIEKRQSANDKKTRLSMIFQEISGEITYFISKFRHRAFFVFIEIGDIQSCSTEIKERILINSSGYIAILPSYSILSDDPEIHRECHLCPGPSIIITLDYHEQLQAKILRVQGYEIIDADLSDFEPQSIGNIVANVTKLLSDTSSFLNSSDSNLTTNHRRLIADIAANGFPPIADTYLRFRLSKSNVERFLNILDGFEALVKLSAIILLSNELAIGNSVSDYTTTLSKPPSFGVWIGLLADLLKRETKTGPINIIKSFWHTPTSEISCKLLDAVNGCGFVWRGQAPKSFLQWLNWLVWLRNVSKGHGGVEEKSIGPSIHSFHEMVGLDEVRNKYELKGWIRGEVRSSLQEMGSILPNPYLAVKSSNDRMLALYPFIIIRGCRCLIWNSTKDTNMEFVDCSTGHIERVKFKCNDIFEEWRTAQTNFYQNKN